jgi:prepilin-type N-terminal cleavage/methylation domain-containing protein
VERYRAARDAASAKRRRAGFTLVEVIVVLVILAILAAIAIPALTGYIDKADDKKYISLARNAVVAMRAVIDEGYAEGTFGAGLPDNGEYSDYLTNGESAAVHIKVFNPNRVSLYDSGTVKGTPGSDWNIYKRETRDLLGMSYSGNEDPGYDIVYFVAPDSGDYTFYNAPGWAYFYYPNGRVLGTPLIFVTYGLDDITPDSTAANNQDAYEQGLYKNATYNPDAGYKVYHSEWNYHA